MASVISDTFLKSLPEEDDMTENGEFEPVSVIAISDNNARELNQHLPLLLSQTYPVGYEVIVVISKNDDNTGDVLKTYMTQYANLHSTFVPDSSRYMSRRKLAVTLGVKAAKHNLILLTDAECSPKSDKWIQAMAASGLQSNASIVVGYSNYASDTKPFRLFHRLHRQYTLMREIVADRPYATVCRNLMFGKNMFLDGKGFQGNLKYLRGEYEFLVNKYGENNKVVIATSPDSCMTEDKPTNKAYSDSCVFHVETSRHLCRGFMHRAFFNADMLALNTSLFFSVAAVIYGGLAQKWIIVAFAVLFLFLPLFIRALTARRATRFFDSKISPACAVAYELRIIWHNLAVFLRYKRADKTDFISHKS